MVMANSVLEELSLTFPGVKFSPGILSVRMFRKPAACAVWDAVKPDRAVTLEHAPGLACHPRRVCFCLLVHCR